MDSCKIIEEQTCNYFMQDEQTSNLDFDTLNSQDMVSYYKYMRMNKFAFLIKFAIWEIWTLFY